MIVRSLESIVDTERDVAGPGWNSRRLLLASDGMGFSMTDLGTLPFVEEIHGLGVCQSGSIIASAAVTDHRIKKIAMVSGMMAADPFQWTDRDTVNAQIAAANASMQKMYETGEPDYVNTIGLDDSQSREEFVGSGVNPMAEETYEYYGRDGIKGPVAVPTFTNAHIGDQGMQSLI